VGKKLKFVRISFLSSLVLLHGVSAKKPGTIHVVGGTRGVEFIRAISRILEVV